MTRSGPKTVEECESAIDALLDQRTAAAKTLDVETFDKVDREIKMMERRKTLVAENAKVEEARQQEAVNREYKPSSLAPPRRLLISTRFWPIPNQPQLLA